VLQWFQTHAHVVSSTCVCGFKHMRICHTYSHSVCCFGCKLMHTNVPYFIQCAILHTVCHTSYSMKYMKHTLTWQQAVGGWRSRPPQLILDDLHTQTHTHTQTRVTIDAFHGREGTQGLYILAHVIVEAHMNDDTS